MDLPAILVKTAGALLLGWTLFSIYRHLRDKMAGHSQSQTEVQSISELVLNNILLYVWFAFMLILSSGMILNN